MNQLLVPFRNGARKRGVLLAMLAGLAAAALYWFLVVGRQADTVAATNMLYTVVPLDLNLRIVKDGELQAVKNIDIASEVEGQVTIQTLVDEGATVKAGDVLMTLDSSAIKQKIEDTTLEVQQADVDLSNSKEMLAIQESQNAADLGAAEVAVVLADLDLKQYEQGTLLQQQANAKTDLSMADINLKNQEEKLSQTRALFEKGFVTDTEVKNDQLGVTNARNTMSKAVTSLKVLTDYTSEMNLASKQSAASQAKLKLERTRRIGASNLSQRVADVQAKTQSLSIIQRRLERYQAQFEACTIKAPADGLVVYASSNDHFAQVQIQEGSSVRERQMLFRLPVTSSMKSVVRIQEAIVPRLREGQRAQVRIVGLPTPFAATLAKISVLADNKQRFINPDLKEYPVDLVLDETPPGLKPGMGTLCEIFVDTAVDVLAVPISTIFSAGQDTYVFVQQQDRVEPRKVHIGRTNEMYAEILDDVVENGDQLVILETGQGQALLDIAGIKAAPTTEPSNSSALAEPRSGGNEARTRSTSAGRQAT